MSGVRLQLEVKSESVLDALKRLLAVGSDLLPALDDIGFDLVERVRDCFSDGCDPYGNAWKKSRRAEEEGGETLRDTSRLMNSITHRVKESSVEVGTNVEYAGTHQFGAAAGAFGTVMASIKPHARTITQAWGKKLKAPKKVQVSAHSRKLRLPWGTIPARPFLPDKDLPAEWEKSVLAIVQEHLQRAVE